MLYRHKIPNGTLSGYQSRLCYAVSSPRETKLSESQRLASIVLLSCLSYWKSVNCCSMVENMALYLAEYSL